MCRGRGDDDVLIEDATDDVEDDDNEQRRNPHFGRWCGSRADAGVATSTSDLYFQRNIERLEYYQKVHGQGKLPPCDYAGSLSKWIYVQQLMARPEGRPKGGTIYRLSAVRREQLEALGVPFGALPGKAQWMKRDDAMWDIKFEELKTFHEREGRWPSMTSKQAQKNPEEKTIGSWIHDQRTAQRTGKRKFHGSSRQQRLLAIGAIQIAQKDHESVKAKKAKASGDLLDEAPAAPAYCGDGDVAPPPSAMVAALVPAAI